MSYRFQALKASVIQAMRDAHEKKLKVVRLEFAVKELETLLSADRDDVGDEMLARIVENGWPVPNGDPMGYQRFFGFPFRLAKHSSVIVSSWEPEAKEEKLPLFATKPGE